MCLERAQASPATNPSILIPSTSLRVFDRAMSPSTMLRLCHELPRYSLDLDFWFYKETDFSDFFRRLRDAASAGYEITDAQEKFHSLLLEMRIARGTTKLKIEVRKKVAPTGSSEQKIAYSPFYASQVLMRGFTLKQMFKNKVSALIERGEVRDAFDLEFLVRKGIEPDLSDEERKAVIRRLKGFKKRDFDVKLGSIILPDLREYYRANRFAFLDEKLAFEEWK